MNETQRLRYSRQIRLPSLGERGQLRLLKSRVLIIGMGGLGSAAGLYLTAAGLGHLIISDFDRVELSNLQRQIVHRMTDVGELKTTSAKTTFRALNPDIQVTALDFQLDGESLMEAALQADVMLDCSDNFATRFAVNAASIKTKTPLVSGAAARFEGQITTFIPGLSESPCYRCLYRGNDRDALEGETCSEEGVLAPVVGVIGSLQAVEAIKVLTGIGEPLCGRLLMWDALEMAWRSVRLPKDPHCPVCGGQNPGALGA